MDNYPPMARDRVAALAAAARAAPERAVAFQGAPGAYSHLATRALFPDAIALPCFAFEDALDAVRTGLARYGVIPIENSLHGRVTDIHFLLPNAGLFIVGEHFMPISHCLLAPAGQAFEAIREAVSHPQALGQCRNTLRGWGIQPVQYADTAAAAALVASEQQPGIAAIASRLAAEVYGLDILRAAVEDEPDNTTRFIILSREAGAEPVSGPAITSLLFETRSVPAALFKALGGFATNGVNMVKLESYLSGASFQVAQFYCEIEGRLSDANVALALEELRFHTKWVKVLGCYPARRDTITGGETQK